MTQFFNGVLFTISLVILMIVWLGTYKTPWYTYSSLEHGLGLKIVLTVILVLINVLNLYKFK